jgi:signal transduction histidine kinase
MSFQQRRMWRYLRGLAPVLFWGLFIAVVIYFVPRWLRSDEQYDQESLREWIFEARIFRKSLPELVGDYMEKVDKARQTDPNSGPDTNPLLQLKINQIQEHLRSMGDPLTKMYPGQLPLFPIIYRLEINFDVTPPLPPIVWDSSLPRPRSQESAQRSYTADLSPNAKNARLTVQYQLHAYDSRERLERQAKLRQRGISLLTLAGTVVACAWIYLAQKGEREHERQRAQSLEQVEQARRSQEEAERNLLEQRLAAQAAEQKALELKSQIYASIGIMAGSYAHNIKNLLVRPNDLLRRCLGADGLAAEQEQMLHEVRQTLGLVTERLQLILRTVRRDPGQAERTRLDLNDLLRDLEHTWKEMAREKWKLTMHLDLAAEPLWIEGDWSHLQQTVENLLFNARDATFEMRGHLREQARGDNHLAPPDRRQALIAAAGWKGEVHLRTRQEAGHAVLEVSDNGIGMTEDIRQRCIEPHYTTKRDNALYEGHNTGMGLGLSFVVAILEHHGAALEIESKPLQGTLFRVSFTLKK